MTCPGCSSESTKVTNTYPGVVVTRRHRCKRCERTWRSKEKLEHGSLSAICAPLVATQPLLAITGRSEPCISGSENSSTEPDPNPDSPGNPIRAGARRAKKAPSYEPAFLRIWDFTGKVGNKFKGQRAWISVGRPEFDLIQRKYLEYTGSIQPWQSRFHLSTWLNNWGHTQEYTPAKAEAPKRPEPMSFAAREDQARARRAREQRLKSLVGGG